MSVKTIAILMPGDMGHGCAIAFRENGFRVVTNLVERSERTKGLSAKACLEDLGSREQPVLADYDSANVLLLCCLQLMMARLDVCVLLHTR